MKKDKKMMAMMHRVNVIMTKSDELSRKLSLKIVEECTGEESAMVALYAYLEVVYQHVKEHCRFVVFNFRQCKIR